MLVNLAFVVKETVNTFGGLGTGSTFDTFCRIKKVGWAQQHLAVARPSHWIF